MEETCEKNLKVDDGCEMKTKTEEDCEVKNKTEEGCEEKLKVDVCELKTKVEENCEVKEKMEEECIAKEKMEEDCEAKEEKEEDSKLHIDIEEFLGKKYVMVRQENFEAFLLFLGKGYLARKAALSLHPEVCLTRNQDSYTFSFHSILVSYDVTFVPGEEFDEVKPDGKVKSVITFEGNKMIHNQTDDRGRVARHAREFFHDKMITTTTAEGLDKTVIRYHELVQ